jgi:hypothetical protein
MVTFIQRFKKQRIKILVGEEIILFHQKNPDLMLSDFRLSLSTSYELALKFKLKELIEAVN